MHELEEQLRRMVFNLVARNQDDHVKNIAFLMDRTGQWSLSPAFDITWSFNPAGDWTATHQMTVALLWELMRARGASISPALLLTCGTFLPPRCRQRMEKGVSSS